MDDKGTVYIVSFGLRESLMLNAAVMVINAAQDMLKLAFSVNIKAFIGFTHGKVFMKGGKQSRHTRSCCKGEEKSFEKQNTPFKSRI